MQVLFLYEPYDELVLMQLGQYDKKSLQSLETLVAEDASDTDTVAASDDRAGSITQEAATRLVEWAEKTLGSKIKKVKVCVNLFAK